MTKIAVMECLDGVVLKYAPFENEDEALAHIEKHRDNYPDAFVADEPTKPGVWKIQEGEVVVEEFPEVFQPLNRVQFKAMVKFAQLETAILGAIAEIPDPLQQAVAQAKYEESTRYDRDDSLFAMLAPAVGLTDEQLDDMWRQAAAIK